MSEWKLFDGDVAPFTDDDFYRDRDAAHHLEEAGHVERIHKACEFVAQAYAESHGTVSDFGCGDGGLLDYLRHQYGIQGWGYDMAPNNVKYAQFNRQLDVRLTDFSTDADVEYGHIVVMTEVLEHITDPHGALAAIPKTTKYIVASSPRWETPENHYEFHNWAWDDTGYAQLIQGAGFTIVRHENAWINQVILGAR
jgi:2-polyprenyl-3-methyl-5-hydroxy-6-metoxy-1,4-benzoquinol methylase